MVVNPDVRMYLEFRIRNLESHCSKFRAGLKPARSNIILNPEPVFLLVKGEKRKVHRDHKKLEFNF